jgi:methyl-accepting chemotaxis protein
MNMMSLQERHEEQAVPDFVRQLRADSVEDDWSDPAVSAATPRRTTLLERMAWFRNLSLAGKINAIFGSFFAAGLLMSLVLGLGLTELWNRYQSSARVQEAVVAASELQSAAGELRYHSVRALYDSRPALREQQRASESTMMAQVTALEAAMTADAADLQPQAANLRADLDNFRTSYETAQEAVRNGASASASVQDTATQGSALVDASAALASELAVRGEAQEASGIAYFFNMVLIIGILAVAGGTVLLLGLAYLSRDFSRKIVEITDGMTRLADGDRNFEIEGQERRDEIGAMIRALDLFKRASKRLETWARERSEKAEQELQL